MSNPIFDRYLNQTRADLGMTVVYDAEAVRRTTRSIKEGRAIGFLADQGVLNLASTHVPFFGRPAKTPRGPAVFTLRYRVPTLFVAAVREPDGHFHVSFEPVPYEETGDRERDVSGSSRRTRAFWRGSCDRRPSSTSGTTGGGSTSRPTRQSSCAIRQHDTRGAPPRPERFISASELGSTRIAGAHGGSVRCKA